MLEEADVVVLAAPWTPGTNRILDAAAIVKDEARGGGDQCRTQGSLWMNRRWRRR